MLSAVSEFLSTVSGEALAPLSDSFPKVAGVFATRWLRFVAVLLAALVLSVLVELVILVWSITAYLGREVLSISSSVWLAFFAALAGCTVALAIIGYMQRRVQTEFEARIRGLLSELELTERAAATSFLFINPKSIAQELLILLERLYEVMRVAEGSKMDVVVLARTTVIRIAELRTRLLFDPGQRDGDTPNVAFALLEISTKVEEAVRWWVVLDRQREATEVMGEALQRYLSIRERLFSTMQ